MRLPPAPNKAPKSLVLGHLHSTTGSITYSLCDLKQVTKSLCTSVSVSIECVLQTGMILLRYYEDWENELTKFFFNKITNIMHLIQCTAYNKFLINVRAVICCCYYEHHHSHYHHSYQDIKYKEKEKKISTSWLTCKLINHIAVINMVL